MSELCGSAGRLRLAAFAAAFAVLGAAMDAAKAQETWISPALVEQLRNYFDVRIASGRIVARSPNFGGEISSATSGRDGRQQRFVIRATDGQVSIEFESSTPTARLTLNLESGRSLTIRKQAGAASDAPTEVEFRQPIKGAVLLRAAVDGKPQEFRAAGLWQLYLAEPEVCRRELSPLLELLRPEWKLSDRAAAAEADLLAFAHGAGESDLASLNSLVSDLASVDFARRASAERSLRDQGPAALPFLLSLDRRRLDSEQWFRVRRLQRELSGAEGEDTPQQIAISLFGDPRVWCSLMSRAEEDDRCRLAAAQLKRIMKAPIQYDRQGDAITRTRQLAALREQIDRQSPLPASDDSR